MCRPWEIRQAMKNVVANHLIVALNDNGDKKKKMSLEQWKVVEMKMLNTLVDYMEETPKNSYHHLTVQDGLLP